MSGWKSKAKRSQIRKRLEKRFLQPVSWQNGLGMLIVAWLVSPLGIPLAAVWALDGLEKLEGWLVEKVYH